MKKKRDGVFPGTRIRKILQADEDVGKIQKGALPMVSRAVELFEGELMRAVWSEAKRSGSKKLTVEHFAAVARSDARFGFLTSLMGQGAAAPVAEAEGEVVEEVGEDEANPEPVKKAKKG